MITDKQRIDFLESQNSKKKYTGRCLFRWSTYNRGWRLHETKKGYSSVREAIDDGIEKLKVSTHR